MFAEEFLAGRDEVPSDGGCCSEQPCQNKPIVSKMMVLKTTVILFIAFSY
jgi:hypothetical protein